MGALLVACVQAASAQLTSLPKYDIGITVDPSTVEPGAQARVTSHVTLLYCQMGKDPSVPGVYVEYEVKARSGAVVMSSVGGGYTDETGHYYADIKMPSTPGEYTIVARAYDVPGREINGQSEAYFKVAAKSAATTTPGASTAIPPTAVPPLPSSAPTGPGFGGLGLGGTELLIIGAVIFLVLILVLVVAVAAIAFLWLRRKKPEPPKPAELLPEAEKPSIGPARFCMHCGATMSMDAPKCPNCGLIPPSGVDVKSCTACGAVIPEAAKYCDKCGARQPEPKKE